MFRNESETKSFFEFFEFSYQFTKRFHHQSILYEQNQIFEIDFFSFFRFFTQPLSDEQKSTIMTNETEKKMNLKRQISIKIKNKSTILTNQTPNKMISK